MDNDSDEALLQKIQEGSHSAFAVLVRRHARRFYRASYRFVSAQEEAEDIVQECFLRLWENPFSWQKDRQVRFTTWFYRIVVNRSLDSRKKENPTLLDDDIPLASGDKNQEEALIQAEKNRLLEQAIASLPERQRIALNLCFYEELSNQEAADIMGLGIKALQSLVMRAKLTVKEKIRGHNGRRHKMESPVATKNSPP